MCVLRLALNGISSFWKQHTTERIMKLAVQTSQAILDGMALQGSHRFQSAVYPASCSEARKHRYISHESFLDLVSSAFGWSESENKHNRHWASPILEHRLFLTLPDKVRLWHNACRLTRTCSPGKQSNRPLPLCGDLWTARATNRAFPYMVKENCQKRENYFRGPATLKVVSKHGL